MGLIWKLQLKANPIDQSLLSVFSGFVSTSNQNWASIFKSVRVRV